MNTFRGNNHAIRQQLVWGAVNGVIVAEDDSQNTFLRGYP
jgi:hypothetical protein